jgi:hypothetical protein
VVARSLNGTLTEAARAAVQASDWELDREAWNLPHAKDEAVPRPADPDDGGAAERHAQPEGDKPATPPKPK